MRINYNFYYLSTIRKTVIFFCKCACYGSDQYNKAKRIYWVPNQLPIIYVNSTQKLSLLFDDEAGCTYGLMKLHSICQRPYDKTLLLETQRLQNFELINYICPILITSPRLGSAILLLSGCFFSIHFFRIPPRAIGTQNGS